MMSYLRSTDSSIRLQQPSTSENSPHSRMRIDTTVTIYFLKYGPQLTLFTIVISVSMSLRNKIKLPKCVGYVVDSSFFFILSLDREYHKTI